MGRSSRPFSLYTYVHTFYKNELKIATLPLTDKGIRLAAQRNEAGKELVERFNQGIAVLKANGEYHKLLERWGLVDTSRSKINAVIRSEFLVHVTLEALH